MASLRGFLWTTLLVIAWCGTNVEASCDAARVLATTDRPAFDVLLEDRDDTPIVLIEARSDVSATASPRSVAHSSTTSIPTDSDEAEGSGALPSRAPPFEIF